jgi:radical SAM protein with 4Fe4S-binding SPASM domain
MNLKLRSYKLMRIRKYYDALRTDEAFLKTSAKQKYKIFSNILKFFSINSKKPLIIKNKPVTAQIEPTSECNLQCGMCIRKNMGVSTGTMSFENFKKILDKLDSLFKIQLTGQGEPFLAPEIFDMIKYANKRGILVNINTNATLLNEKIIENIISAYIGEIGISIDSTKKKKYEKIRKGANYERVLKNIKNLSDKIKEKNRKTILTIAPIIFKDNIDELPEFVELAKKLGINKISFQTLQTKENFFKSYDSHMKSQLVKSDMEKLKNKIEEAKFLAQKYNITVIFDEAKSLGCIWPWRSIYITWDGEITPCCKIVEWKKFPIGNILNEDFWKIWNGDKYQEYRKLLKKREAPLACRGCNSV